LLSLRRRGVSARMVLLVDDRAESPGLETEHGLSFYVETKDAAVLLDTGQSGGVLARNAAALGVDLGRVGAIVLSHGHYDHTGGLAEALRLAPRARVFACAGAARPRFSAPLGKGIGAPRSAVAALEAAAGRATWLTGPAEVAPGVWVTGPVPRIYDQEAVSGPFFLDKGFARPDPLDDDQTLWLRVEGGVAAVMGCAHAGVANILECVARQSGAGRVRGVIGGLHLKAANEARLVFTAAALERWGVELVATCHCTGESAAEFLERRLRGKARARGAGAEWAL